MINRTPQERRGQKSPIVPPAIERRHMPHDGNIRFCRYFKHWRSGKILDAQDYGYKAWPIGRHR